MCFAGVSMACPLHPPPPSRKVLTTPTPDYTGLPPPDEAVRDVLFLIFEEGPLPDHDDDEASGGGADGDGAGGDGDKEKRKKKKKKKKNSGPKSLSPVTLEDVLLHGFFDVDDALEYSEPAVVDWTKIEGMSSRAAGRAKELCEQTRKLNKERHARTLKETRRRLQRLDQIRLGSSEATGGKAGGHEGHGRGGGGKSGGGGATADGAATRGQGRCGVVVAVADTNDSDTTMNKKVE